MELAGVSAAVDPNADVYKTPEEDGGQDMFLKLLVTQLQNQDPLDPMDNTEFVAQLAQFRQLEALTNVDNSMSDMSDSVAGMQNLNSANLIGKSVKLEGNGLYFAGDPVLFGYELPEGAAKVSIKVYNSSYQLVKETDLNGAGRGEYDYTWDGTDFNGTPLPQGPYTFSVQAVDAEGLPLEAIPHSIGMVTSVVLETDGVTVMAGGNATSMDKIREIY